MDTESMVAIVSACVALIILVILFIYSLVKTWQEISIARAFPEVYHKFTEVDSFQSPVASHASKPNDDVTTTEENSHPMFNVGFERDVAEQEKFMKSPGSRMETEVEVNAPVTSKEPFEGSTTAL